MSSFGGPPNQGANYNMGFNQPRNPYPGQGPVPMSTPVPIVPMPTPGAPGMGHHPQPLGLGPQPMGFNPNPPYQNNPHNIGLVPPPPHVHPGYGAPPPSLAQAQFYGGGLSPVDPKQMKKADKEKKKEMKKSEKDMEKLAKQAKKGVKDVGKKLKK